MGKIKYNFNIPMIMHDWNAGATTTQLCKIYGFSSPQAAADRISRWRREGWEFKRKPSGAPRDSRGRWIESEGITAGTVLQSKGGD